MAFALAPEAAAAGYRLAVFDTIGSTSDEAGSRARAGEGGPLWIVSAHQTAGRGRRGAGWATPPGNLAASLLLTTDRPAAEIATLGFVAGVALVRALDAVRGSRSPPAGEGGPRVSEGRMRGEAPGFEGLPSSVVASRRHLLPQREKGSRFALKWPNDVLADGAKLAGILLGTESLGAGRQAVVVGIGVNVRHAPAGLPYPAASLVALGVGRDAEALFAALSREWVAVHAAWSEPGGFEAVRSEWLGRAAGIGEAVSVRTGEAVLEGRFETLDPMGRLVVRTPDGSARFVSAGEVHFGRAATVRAEQRA